MGPKRLSSENTEELRRKMERVGIFEEDLTETFVRSSGPGGQNVNKVSTCVVLWHRPSGIKLKSQEERSQALNRYRARCRLVAMVQEQQKALRQKAVDDREKRNRQNRKRPKALKENILKGKRLRAEKKISRRKIPSDKSERNLF
jgi:protein subunit release factor B